MPRIPRIVAQPTQLGRRADGNDFGGGQGTRALAGAADQVSQAALAFADAGQRANVSNEVAASAAKLNELSAELDSRMSAVGQEEDPFASIETLRKEYRSRANEILEGSRSKIRGSSYQQLFQERTFALTERFGQQVNEKARARGLERIRAQTVTSVDTLTDLIEKTDNDDLRKEYIGQIRGTLSDSVASGAITEDRAAQIVIGVEDRLQRSELIATAQQGADEIVDTIASPTERLKAARERFTGDQRDNVIARIKDRNAEESMLAKAEDDARFDAAVTRAQAGQLSREQALRIGLSGRDLNTVIAVIDQQQSAQPPKLDPEYYNDLNRIAVDDPAGFANARLDPAKLGSQYTRMVDMQRSVRERGQLDAGEGYLKARVKEALSVAEITDEETQANFRRSVDEELSDTAERLGRKPNKQEVREIVDGLMVEVSRPSTGFIGSFLGLSSDTRRFELGRNDEIGRIPAIAIPAVTDLLEAQGIDSGDEAQIVEAYQLYKSQLEQAGILATPEMISRAIQLELEGLVR